MDNIALYALGNMTNSSSAMFERRRRILNEARKMIGRDGLDAFSIRELCKRAGVASRTLYYAFDSKENIIALAIGTYYEEFERRLEFDRHPASLESAIIQQVTTTLRNQQLPNYLKAVAALYFSPSLHPRIRDVLLSIGGRAWKPWVQTLVLDRQLQKGVDSETLLIDLSNLLFAKVHEWGLGILSNEEFQNRSIDAVLIHLAGALKGAALSTVRDAFVRWRNDSDYNARIIADAHARLAIVSFDRQGDHERHPGEADRS